MNILITGATSGIGRQLVLDYSKSGHRVYACGRSLDKLEALKKDCGKAEEHVQLLQFDVTDREAVRTTLDSLEQVDLVILNAGVCEYVNELSDFKSELFERVFAANYFGVVNCVDALLPKLRAGSRLAIVDSMARLMPFTRAEAYASSKAAVHYLGNSLKVDLAPHGIAVTTISPGFVETPMTDANDFEMPMKITVADASKAIQKGLAKGKAQIYFPRVFGWILRFIHKLPLRLQIAISRRMKNAQ